MTVATYAIRSYLVNQCRGRSVAIRTLVLLSMGGEIYHGAAAAR